jgi:hypothetical protein
VTQYGADAWLIAARRADALLELGDMDGGVWRRVLKAVEELQRKGRREREQVN